MKFSFVRIALTAAVCGMSTLAFGQQPSYYSKNPDVDLSSPPTTYIGIGTGLNSMGLLGVSFEENFQEKASFVATAGLGTWGYKLTFGGRYYLSYPAGKAFGISYGMATGLSKVQLNLEDGSGNKKMIDMQLKPVHLINLTYHKFWRLGRGNSRFGVELGYSISISPAHQYKVLDQGVTLSDTSVKVLTLLQPGGLIAGMNFTFGK